MLRQVAAIVAKDLAAEVHTREILSAMAVFAVIAVLIFSFTLDLRGAAGRAAAPGVLWTTVAFAGTLGLSRSLAREQASGGLAGLLLAAEDRTAVFLGKALGNLVLLSILEAMLLPLTQVLFDVSLLQPSIWLIMLLGSVGYALAGTLLAAMAVDTRAREVMLPILLLPLVVPLLLAAVNATAGLLDGLPLAGVGGWLRILVVYDLLVAAVSMLTFGFVVGG